MRKILEEKNLTDKKILLRLDLNVPLISGKITDTTRIDKIIPTLNYLIKKKSKIIIISHVGRPKGKKVSDLSLKPICKNIESKIRQSVKLITKNIYKLNVQDLFSNSNDKIVMLENIRFYSQEETNDYEFANYLSSLADIYVNDAFSCSHRAHATIDKITQFLPSYSGLQFDLEVDALKKITSKIKKPIICIIGGSKISTKINIIKNLISKFDYIVIVGGMANNLLKYMGHNIGKSIYEENSNSVINEIFILSKKENCKIYYPEDVVVSKDLYGVPESKEIDKILSDEMILDIGEKTIKKIENLIDESKTVFWNGPAGYFENLDFANGSLRIAKKIVENNNANTIYSVAGGGDTVSLLNKLNAVSTFNFVSTAGGAFLEYLEGKQLPGITALKKLKK
ncbi:phosphoglycerate kinase [Candidatus Pelagibacter sp.]|nr:phosphoglycerate kinase [Candidatus Pelagibacter sp.]